MHRSKVILVTAAVPSGAGRRSVKRGSERRLSSPGSTFRNKASIASSDWGTVREQQAPNTVENRGARRKKELDDSTT